MRARDTNPPNPAFARGRQLVPIDDAQAFDDGVLPIASRGGSGGGNDKSVGLITPFNAPDPRKLKNDRRSIYLAIKTENKRPTRKSSYSRGIYR